MFDCPRCGKPGSSFDGVTFCGPCETIYQSELKAAEERDKADARARGKTHSDDCDCALCAAYSRGELNPDLSTIAAYEVSLPMPVGLLADPPNKVKYSTEGPASSILFEAGEHWLTPQQRDEFDRDGIPYISGQTMTHDELRELIALAKDMRHG